MGDSPELLTAFLAGLRIGAVPGAGQHDAQAEGHRRAGRGTAAPASSRSARSSPSWRPPWAACPTWPTSSSSPTAPAPRCPRSTAPGCATGTRSWPPARTSSSRPPRRTRRSPTPPRSGSTRPAPPARPRARCTGTGRCATPPRPTPATCSAIGPDDVTFSVAKFFFAYGLGNTMTFPFAVGASTVLDRSRPSPAGTLRVLRDLRPTLFFGGPTYFAALLAAGLPPGRLHRRAGLRLGRRGVPGGAVRALHVAPSASRCSTASARRRCCTSSSAAAPAGPAPGATGEIVAGYDAKIVDDDGAPVPDGTPGNLFVRGSSAATGYWCRDGDHAPGVPGRLGAHR